jgi:hypothetical protein
MRNTMAYPIQQLSPPSRSIPCSHKRGNDNRVKNAIPKHASPEAKGSNTTTALSLLWARKPLTGHFNHWQVS